MTIVLLSRLSVTKRANRRCSTPPSSLPVIHGTTDVSRPNPTVWGAIDDIAYEDTPPCFLCTTLVLWLAGCRMVDMSCEDHDRHAAGSQFITHTIGRILSHLDLESTPINTKGYESLLKLTDNTVSDIFNLYYGLFMYNVNASDQIENLDRAFETVKQKLFGRLHEILRKQIVHRVPIEVGPTRSTKSMPGSKFLPSTGKLQDFSSFVIPPPL